MPSNFEKQRANISAEILSKRFALVQSVLKRRVFGMLSPNYELIKENMA